MAKEIIITRIFPKSEYLQNGNIGHEIINLFKADDNNPYYIYLMSGGDYSYDHENCEVDTVLLTRGINKNCVEILAKAERITKIFKPNEQWKGASIKEFQEMGRLIKEKGIENIQDDNTIPKKIRIQIQQYHKQHQEQVKRIQEDDIRYGGILLHELFSQNAMDDYGLSLYVTFEAKTVVLAKEPVYLYIGENQITEKDLKLHDRKRLSGSALTTYYQENTQDYKNLKEKIINNSDLWKKEPVGCYTKFDTQEDPFTFLTLTGNQYDELSFSNMFAYYFNQYIGLLKSFLEKVKFDNNSEYQARCRAISDSLTTKPEIKREEKNIDLLIQTSPPIVIENKIKSKINGEKHDIYGNVIGTQLTKYYEYVKKNYEEPLCFIFSPNYNPIDKSKILSSEKEKYHIVYYSELRDIFKEFYTNHPDLFENDPYFKDFLKALNYHSSPNDNRFEEISRRKMQTLIEGRNNA